MALLVAPSLALAVNKNGKKYFKEGVHFELTEKWDQAAEQFALALNEEPGNAEYVVHYRRSLIKASIMFMDRGAHFEESKDWSSAYQAYRQAYSYDPSNEAARGKMKIMLDKQGIPNDNGTPIPKDQAEKQASDMGRVVSFNGEDLRPIPGKRKTPPPKSDISFQKGTSVRQVVQSLAKTLKLNVLFDDAYTDKQLKENFTLEGVTTARALDLFLLTNKLFYTQADVRTIILAQDTPQNRLRYQEMFVKTFYIRNGELNDIRTMIGTQVGTKNIAPIKNLNALVVRDTAPNLQLIESLINSVDKTPSEVLVDVNMYEIAHNDLLQIGNQFVANSTGGPSLTNFGGFFGPKSVTTDPIRDAAGNIIQAATTKAIYGGLTALVGPGMAIAVPASQLSALQTKGRSKLIARSQVRAFEGEETETKVGQSVPVQTAQLPYYSTGTPTTATPGNGNNNNNLNNNLLNPFGNTGYPQIQYKDVGLVIKMKPKVSTSGDVQLKMHIESTGVQSLDTLTPIFTQRSMDGVAQTKDGQTEMIAGILQTTEDNSASGLPLIGLIPILGNFFTTPTHKTQQNDIIVTVTPHILRSATFTDSDRSASPNGDSATQGARVSLQEIVDRYEQYESVTEAANREREVALRETAAPPKTQTNSPPANVNVIDRSPKPNQPPPEPVPATSVLPSNDRQPTSGLINKSTTTNPATNATRTTNSNAELKDPGEEGDNQGDDQQEQALSGPVQLLVRTSVSQAKIGQTVVVAVYANGNSDLMRAKVVLDYNADVLKLTQVRDGGLFRTGGLNPDLNSSDGTGGQVVATIARPPDAKPVRANAQLLIFIFEAVAVGNSDLVINPGTEIIAAAGAPVPVSSVPAKVAIIGQEENK